MFIGNQAPTGSYSYVIEAGQSQVSLLSNFGVNSLMDLIDQNLVITPMPVGAEVDETETAIP